MRKILTGVLLSLILLVQSAGFPVTSKAEESSVWDTQLPEILENIEKPTFPDKNFFVEDFGAVADGTVKSTEAFNDAIMAAHEAGGGRVVVGGTEVFNFSTGKKAAAPKVSDDERLTILKMLQEKKISVEDAENLFTALEGKGQ